MKEVIRLDNIRRDFVVGDEVVHALRGISLTITEGEFVTIMGTSGSGKSTLLNTLGCLDTPTSGEYYLDGIAVRSMDKNARATLRNRKIGFVFQNYNLFRNKTALQNVTEGLIVARKMPKNEANAIGMKMLEKVGLADRADYYPRQLSGGQQQRIAIARALCAQTKIILFDEPTSALDPELTGEVLRVLRDLADRKTTMIIVTHEMHFARDVADRILFMDGGVVVEEGPAKQLIDHPREQRTKQFLAHYAE